MANTNDGPDPRTTHVQGAQTGARGAQANGDTSGTDGGGATAIGGATSAAGASHGVVAFGDDGRPAASALTRAPLPPPLPRHEAGHSDGAVTTSGSLQLGTTADGGNGEAAAAAAADLVDHGLLA